MTSIKNLKWIICRPLIQNIVLLWINFQKNLSKARKGNDKIDQALLLEKTDKSDKNNMIAYKLWNRLIYRIYSEKIYNNIKKVNEILIDKEVTVNKKTFKEKNKK